MVHLQSLFNLIAPALNESPKLIKDFYVHSKAMSVL